MVVVNFIPQLIVIYAHIFDLNEHSFKDNWTGHLLRTNRLYFKYLLQVTFFII